MKKKSSFIRLYQKLLASTPMSWLMARLLHRIDLFVLRQSGGRHTLAEITGVPIIEVTTTGAKSGQQRTLPLTGLPEGEKFILIASNYGQARNPAWYYNLKANPECTVKYDGNVSNYLAREADEQENKHYFDLAVSYYAGYAVYKQRAGKRKIPVMILEPRR